MTIFISLALILLAMVAFVVLLTFGALALAGSAGRSFEEGPMRSGFVPRIAYILLWCLIAGTSFGMIGAG